VRQNIYDDETFFQGYRTLREKTDNFNNLVEQPAIRAMMPTLAGKIVLDLGCGFGDLAVYCVTQGAERVVATDISAKMLAQARTQNARPQIEYVQAAMEELEFASRSFDLVLSSLALHYIKDFAGLIKSAVGWLRPGAEFVFSIEHPLCTAQKADQAWVRDEAGNKLYWPVDDYSKEGKRQFQWYVPGVVKYHRTVSTLLNVLIQNGLTVTEVREPTASEDTIKRLPEYASTRRVPPFLIVRAIAP
jgi:SAM-dependent methyltransferase